MSPRLLTRAPLNTFSLFRPLSTHPDPCQQLSKGQLKHYLSHVHNYKREKIIQDLAAIGLRMNVKATDDRFIEFLDSNNKVRVKLHPPDQMTHYEHMHIYNHKGEPLNISLKPVSRKSPEAHIQIAESPTFKMEY